MEIQEVEKCILDIFPARNPLNPREYLHFMGDPVVALELEVSDSEIHLANIRTLGENHRKGCATAAIKLLFQLSEASRYQITGIIEPNCRAGKMAGKTLNQKQLTDWYRKLGFTIIKNRQIIYFPKSLYQK